MAKRDYYEILGVPRTAKAEDIRKAHRKLVRQYHPDVHKNDAQMEGKFKEVQEAYDVLSDDAKRKKYDQFGHAGVGAEPSYGPTPGGGAGDPFEAFRRAQAGRGGAGPRAGYRRGRASPRRVGVERGGGGGARGSGEFSEHFLDRLGGLVCAGQLGP